MTKQTTPAQSGRENGLVGSNSLFDSKLCVSDEYHPSQPMAGEKKSDQ
jgi:hypothetical protein